jgi:hypothetical protein
MSASVIVDPLKYPVKVAARQFPVQALIGSRKFSIGTPSPSE